MHILLRRHIIFMWSLVRPVCCREAHLPPCTHECTLSVREIPLFRQRNCAPWLCSQIQAKPSMASHDRWHFLFKRKSVYFFAVFYSLGELTICHHWYRQWLGAKPLPKSMMKNRSPMFYSVTSGQRVKASLAEREQSPDVRLNNNRPDTAYL